MTTASVAEIQKELEIYLEKVNAGEEVVILENDAPVARLVALRGDETSEIKARYILEALSPYQREVLADLPERERRMVLEGRLTLAKQKWNPEFILNMPRPQGSASVVAALLEERRESM